MKISVSKKEQSRKMILKTFYRIKKHMPNIKKKSTSVIVKEIKIFQKELLFLII